MMSSTGWHTRTAIIWKLNILIFTAIKHTICNKNSINWLYPLLIIQKLINTNTNATMTSLQIMVQVGWRRRMLSMDQSFTTSPTTCSFTRVQILHSLIVKYAVILSLTLIGWKMVRWQRPVMTQGTWLLFFCMGIHDIS